MRVGRVRYQGEVHLARDEGDQVVLMRSERDGAFADEMVEAIAAGDDLGGQGQTVAASDVEVLAPVRWPSKVLAIGLNYTSHAAEAQQELPKTPLVFSKATSSIVGPGEAISWPGENSSEVDYEAELAVVIGKRAQGEVSDPLSHVFGYTVCNDVSARDAQFADGQWVRGKSFDTFCPLGPWIVTADEFGDPQQHEIGTDITDPSGRTDRLQESSTERMIFGVADLIRYLARFITLEPGDVIATGTPEGVGFARKPPRFLTNGDSVSVWVDGIGSLVNPCTVTSSTVS